MVATDQTRRSTRTKEIPSVTSVADPKPPKRKRLASKDDTPIADPVIAESSSAVAPAPKKQKKTETKKQVPERKKVTKIAKGKGKVKAKAAEDDDDDDDDNSKRAKEKPEKRLKRYRSSCPAVNIQLTFSF